MLTRNLGFFQCNETMLILGQAAHICKMHRSVSILEKVFKIGLLAGKKDAWAPMVECQFHIENETMLLRLF